MNVLNKLARVLMFFMFQLVFACSTQPVMKPPRIEPVASDRKLPDAPPSPLTFEDKKALHIVAVGDIMLGGKARWKLEKLGYEAVFNDTRSLLQQADLTIGNLETALTNRGKAYNDKKYTFKNDPVALPKALKAVGFDIVTLANNHSMDYGLEGLVDTFRALDNQGIKYHGAGINEKAAREAVILERQGQRIGFLAYSNTFPKEFFASETQAGTAFGHKAHIEADIKKLQLRGADAIVVSFHWGRELQTSLRDYQPALAHAAIDAGADLVLGHHPHVLQGVEHYKHGLILYSLGNFAFSTYSNNVDFSAIADIAFHNHHVTALKLTPIQINNFIVELQPRILTGVQAAEVFEALKSYSLPLGTQLHFDGHLIHWRLGF